MRATEQAAIETGAVTGLDLMERAGRGVVEAIFETWPAPEQPDEARREALTLCGPGNNGGDGYVVARLLHARGWSVTCHAFGDPSRLPPDARTNHDLWARIGPVLPWDDSAIAERIDEMPDGLVIDAVFGIGLTRALPPTMDRTGRAIMRRRAASPDRQRPRCVAVDIPSGLGSDTGQDLGGAFPADLTVTFHSLKPGHLHGDGPEICGEVIVKPIGL